MSLAVIRSKKFVIKVTNWHDYNNGLRQRGDFTIYFTEEAIADWHPTKTGARVRPLKYSDIAIETTLFIRQVFHQPLHQTEGFMKGSVALIFLTIKTYYMQCSNYLLI
jgi:hypothetical protein